MRYIKLLALLLAFAGYFNMLANEPVILEYSDTLVGTQDSVTNIRKLVGNVRLRQGNVRITCDNAVQYLNLNKYDLKGNVVIKQNTLTLKSPDIIYDGNTYIATASKGVEIVDRETKLTAKAGKYSTMTLIAEFEKNVVVEDDSVIIFSDYVRHNRNDRVSNAWGNVLIIGKYTNAWLIGDSVINVPAANFSEVFGSPKLLQIDSLSKVEEEIEKITYDTLTISADKMEAIRDFGDERYIAKGNVEIIRNQMLAKAEKGIYFKDRDRIFLEETPIVWYDSTQLFADTITVYIAKNKLEKLEAKSSAFSVSIQDTANLARKNQLAGDTINIIFESDTLRYVYSTGDARSLYFIDTDEQPDGLVSVSADNIKIELSDGKAENIIMSSQVPGEYLPQHLINNNEKQYYLPGFRFDENRPRKIDYKEFERRKKK